MTDLERLIRQAEELARIAHRDQLDKSGHPYAEHPARVAGRLSDDDQLGRIVAWLHDTVEDTAVTLDELARVFPADVVAAVDAITRRPDEGDDYYRRVRRDPIALRVKYADIADNTDPARTSQLSDQDRQRLAAKYRHALEILDAR